MFKRRRNSQDPRIIQPSQKETTSSTISKAQSLNFGILNPQTQPSPSPSLAQLLLSLPTKNRWEQSVRPFCYLLYKSNPFFKKLEYITCVQFVCNCPILEIKKGQALYRSDCLMNASYVVLWGSVEGVSQEGDWVQGAGGTLCEEYLMVGSRRTNGEEVRAGGEGAAVIRISYQGLRAVKKALNQIIPNKDIEIIQQIFQKNYFKKRSVRNSFEFRTK